MANVKTTRRYSLIFQKLSGNYKPTLDEILQFLEDNDLPTSQRTLERDFQMLRNDFGVSITFDRHNEGYFIDTESSLNPDALYKFLEIANTADVLNTKNRKQQHYIEFQKQNLQKNTHYLAPILEAIDSKLKIEVVYQAFYEGVKKTHLVHPYLVKEYDQRWYVYGWSEESEHFKSYALDRTKSLAKTNESFKMKKVERDEIFSHIIGISLWPKPPEKVVLRFNAEQAKYIDTLPLHHSQTEINRNAEAVTFEYLLIPNFELEQKILMHGETAEVLEPKSLRDKIKNRLVATLNNYE